MFRKKGRLAERWKGGRTAARPRWVVGLLLTTALVSATAVAQTSQTTGTQQGAQSAPGDVSELAKIIKIETRPRKPTQVQENQPVPLDMAFGEIPDIPRALTDGVTAKAYARYVVVEDKLIGQLVLGAVAKDGKQEPLNTEKFVSQFELSSPALPDTSKVVVEGDHDELLGALKRLAEQEPEVEKEKEKESDDGRDGRDGSGGRVGSTTAQNSDAAGYRNPEPMALAEPPPSNISVDVTTDGCSIRVDLAQGLAIQQSRVVTTENGQTTSGSCEDGSDRYPIQKSYAECDSLIDMGAMMAYEQFRLYYQPPSSPPEFVSECAPDKDRGSIIEVTAQGCQSAASPARDRYIINTRTIYRDRTGKVHELEACGPSGDTLPIERDYAACSDYIDMDRRIARPQYEEVVTQPDGTRAKLSQCQPAEDISWSIIDDAKMCEVAIRSSAGEAVQQVRTIYQDTVRGRTVELLPCHDGGEAFELVRDYEACGDSVDLASMTAAPLYQLIYNDSLGKRITLSECQIDRNLQTSVLKDTDSCGILEDPSAGEMVQYARLVYTNRTGAEVEVKSCEPTAKRFAIQRSYRQCEDDVDFAAGEAYPSFQRFWIDGQGKTQYLGECQADTENAYALETTTLGCDLQPSPDGSELIQSDRVVYMSRSGERKVVRACEPNGRTFTIDRDYDVCTDAVNLSDGFAKAQYKRFWTDDFGQRHFLSGCTPDEATMMFEETADGCQDSVRLFEGQVVRQKRTIYTDRSGREVEVMACRDSDTRFSIERSYANCTDTVDLAKRVAYPRFAQAWTDENGVSHQVKECVVDEESPMPLVTDVASCEPAIDLGTNQVVQQARLIYTDRSGATQTVTDCEPTGQRYDIKRDYGTCEDEILLDENRAYANYRRYYLKDGGNQYLDDACVRDADSVADITLDFDACTPMADFESGVVTLQARKVYTDRTNKIQEVRDCQPIDGETLPVQWTTDGCSIRSDMEAGMSHVQKRPFYTWRGQMFNAGECMDRDQSYEHERFYGECPNVLTSTQAIPQYKIGYRDAGGAAHYLTGCRPDESQAFAVTKETCTGDYIHDVAAGQTFGKSTWFYFDTYTGEKKTVAYCSKDMSLSWRHQVQGVGWRSFDAELLSRQLERVYVSVPTGQVEIAAATVRPGAATLPYTYERTDKRGIGSAYYEGCTKYQATEQYKVWKRQDGTLYEQVIGTGPAENLGNACTVVTPTSANQWSLVEDVPYFDSYEFQSQRHYTGYKLCKYGAEKITLRDDGFIVQKETGAGFEWYNLTTPNLIETYNNVRDRYATHNWIISESEWNKYYSRRSDPTYNNNFTCPKHLRSDHVSSALGYLGW